MNDEKNKQKEKEFMNLILDDFKDFVVNSVEEGHHKNFENRLEYLKACLQTYQELENWLDDDKEEERVIFELSCKLRQQREELLACKELTLDEVQEIIFTENDIVEQYIEKYPVLEKHLEDLRDMQWLFKY